MFLVVGAEVGERSGVAVLEVVLAVMDFVLVKLMVFILWYKREMFFGIV